MIVIVSAWIAQHRKLIISAIGAGITIGTLVFGAGNPWVLAITAVAVAAGVYRAPNADPPAPAAVVALPRVPGGRGEATAGTLGAAVTGVRG
jgi:hypothetical protein